MRLCDPGLRPMVDYLPAGRYGFDDLQIGDRIDIGSATITGALIDQFAAVSGDRYALHMDRAYAQSLGYENRVAHGLLVLSVVDGLKNNAKAHLDGLVSLGWNLNFIAPVLAEDTIHAEISILAKQRSRSGARGSVRMEFKVTNQNGRLVQCGHNELLFDLTRRGSD